MLPDCREMLTQEEEMRPTTFSFFAVALSSALTILPTRALGQDPESYYANYSLSGCGRLVEAIGSGSGSSTSGGVTYPTKTATFSLVCHDGSTGDVFAQFWYHPGGRFDKSNFMARNFDFDREKEIFYARPEAIAAAIRSVCGC